MKSGKVIFDLDEPFSEYRNKEKEEEEEDPFEIEFLNNLLENEEYVVKENELEPRRRKFQRTLEKIDNILDNVHITPQFSKNENILKLRNQKM